MLECGNIVACDTGPCMYDVVSLYSIFCTQETNISYCEFEYSVANKPSQLGTDFAGTLHLRVRPIE